MMARRWRLTVPLLASGALALATACGGVPTEPTLGGESPVLVGGAAPAEQDAAIVGRWFRRALATDALGNVFSVETTWTLSADGTAQRRLVTDNLTTGIADELVATGSWTTTGGNVAGTGTLAVRFTAPAEVVLRFPYQLGRDVQGPLLLLDGILYRRLVP